MSKHKVTLTLTDEQWEEINDTAREYGTEWGSVIMADLGWLSGNTPQERREMRHTLLGAPA